MVRAIVEAGKRLLGSHAGELAGAGPGGSTGRSRWRRIFSIAAESRIVASVVLGLRSAADVRHAVETLVERARAKAARLEGILLQREVTGGIEALVGVTTDPTFGPLVVCGLGGVLVELLRDVAFRLTPVSDLDVAEMIASLRSAKLLDGYRGGAAGDRAALASVVRRISAIVEVVPEIRELDLNPVKVLEPGKGAVVVDARIRVGRA